MLLPNPTFFIKILNKFQLILLQPFVHLRQLLKSSKFRCFSDLELRSTVWSVLCYCVLHRQSQFFFFNPSVFGNYFVLCYGVMCTSFTFFYTAGIFWAPYKQTGVLPKYLASLGGLPEADHEGNCWISKGKICPLLGEWALLNEEPPKEKMMVYVQITLQFH